MGERGAARPQNKCSDENLRKSCAKNRGKIDWISGIRVTGAASGLAQPIETKKRIWLRGVDLNHRPLGYEPNELPDCSTPHFDHSNRAGCRQTSREGNRCAV